MKRLLSAGLVTSFLVVSVVAMADMPSAAGASTVAESSAGGLPLAGDAGATAAAAAVMVNGRPADAATLARLEKQIGMKVPAGKYWYDRTSGLAGRWGAPAQTYLPGYDFGVLPREASGGATNILVNGRELSTIEVNTILSLYNLPPSAAPQYAGSYTLDALGNLTNAQGRSLSNLVQLANQAQKKKAQDNFWYSKSGAAGNSDGCGSYVTFPASSSSGNISVDTGVGC